MCDANAQLISMLKILLDLMMINYSIGSSAKINKYLQLSLGFLIFYDFVTKLIQNNQNVKFCADL